MGFRLYKDFLLTVIMGFWLLLCCWQDFRKKEIHIGVIGLGVISIVVSCFTKDISFWNRITGLGLGLVLLFLNPVTGGQIGIGDGLIVSIIGLAVGFYQLSVILILALFGTGVTAAGLLLFKKAGRKATIPFIPFVFFGYLGGLIG